MAVPCCKAIRGLLLRTRISSSSLLLLCLPFRQDVTQVVILIDHYHAALLPPRFLRYELLEQS